MLNQRARIPKIEGENQEISEGREQGEEIRFRRLFFTLVKQQNDMDRLILRMGKSKGESKCSLISIDFDFS